MSFHTKRRNSLIAAFFRLHFRCLFYMKTRRKVDLTNLLEAADDVLVKYHVLADDNSQIVAGHDGSRVLYDKSNPRIEIDITEEV